MLFAMLGAVSGAAPSLLRNPGFEEVDGEGRPLHWQAVDFRTGGRSLLGEDGGREGRRYGLLESRSAAERECWRQLVAVPEGTVAVAVRGWYRTRGGSPGTGERGSSLRVHFHREGSRWSEIGLQQVFLPPSADWRDTGDRFFLLPAEAHGVEVQLFHWLDPGQTHWDEVELRALGQADLAQVGEHLAALVGLDREPRAGANLPYAPGDGAEARVNPPPFLWLPVAAAGRTFAMDQAESYALDISRDPTFAAENTIRRRGVAWCCEMLREPLAPGEWHWRYGFETGTRAGIVWSRRRTFTVPAGADPWPYPAPERFAVTASRPRLFVREGGLADLRRRAAEGDLRETAERLVRSVRGYAGEELVPEPDRLPEGPARGPAYTLTFRATRPPMDRMEQAALAYLLTADADCGREAKRRILHFMAWDPHGSTNVFHNDEPAMWIMMRGVRAYDWTHDLFTPEEARRVETAQLERARDFYRKLSQRPYENNPFESHAGRIIGFLGEAALSFAPESEEARLWLDYITRIYWGVYPAWGGEDGGWNEGPGYWGAYMSFGLHFVVALREATGIDLSRRPFFRNTPYYRLYLTPPYSQMAPFGDGTQFRPNRAGGLMYAFSTLLRDPVLRWYPAALGQGPDAGILGVVLRDDSLEPRPPTELPQSRHFESVGLVSLHSAFGEPEEDVIFNLRSSPYGAVSHGHNDQNCFTLEAYGEALAVATGHYNRYGSPHHDGWTRQTKAKCGITFAGGKGQDRGWHARGRILDFSTGPLFDIVRADATAAYGGRLSRAVREVVHVRPGIFVIRDDLAALEPQRFEYWLHALDRMEVDEQEARVVLRRPKAALTVHFLAPGALTFAQTDAFEPPPTWPPGKEFENNWHLTARAEADAATQFLTVLVPARNTPGESLPTVQRLEGDGALAVRLSWPDGTSTLVCFAMGDRAGDRWSVGGFGGAAPVAAARYGPGGDLRGLAVSDAGAAF